MRILWSRAILKRPEVENVGSYLPSRAINLPTPKEVRMNVGATEIPSAGTFMQKSNNSGQSIVIEYKRLGTIAAGRVYETR